MSNELVVIEQGIMPVMDINQALERRKQMVTFVQKIMIEGTDFGAIPGTDKPTLLKPGAEKLATFFGLTKRFEIIERVEDWTGKEHGGEAFFYYLYRCRLYRGDLLIAEADGSCNSFEAKYRWRKSERVCPNCGKANIRKSKQGGWYCWAKTDGCGATFPDGDKAIEGQEVGRIPNPDICDQVNTLQKMSQKRALIAACLLAVNASEFFTQDLEDFVDVPFTVEESKPAGQPPQTKQGSKPVQPVRTEAPKKTNGNGHGKKPKHPSVIFWETANQMEVAKEAAQGILAQAGNDYEVALDRLTGMAQPPATDDSLGFNDDEGDGGY